MTKKPNQFSIEMREHVVCMVHEHQGEYASVCLRQTGLSAPKIRWPDSCFTFST